MRTLVTGGTGLIGRHLLRKLVRPVVLSRPGSAAREVLKSYDLQVYDWASTSKPPPAPAFDGVDVVVNLAGESLLGGRWTEAKKQQIHDSRVLGTQHLVQTLTQLRRPPRVLISASAIGYYGSCTDRPLDEAAPPGADFLARLCADWEAAAATAQEAGIRVVLLRIGVVLSRGGGALKTMLRPFKLGLGGVLGSGRQWMSWIHAADLTNLIRFAADGDSVAGPLNAVAPESVTNRQFTKTLGRVLHRPTILPAPEFALKLALGDVTEMLLASQRVVPRAALDAGFQFQYPELQPALANLTRRANDVAE